MAPDDRLDRDDYEKNYREAVSDLAPILLTLLFGAGVVAVVIAMRWF